MDQVRILRCCIH